MWAVRLSGNALHVLVIDKSDHDAIVLLRLPATQPATVERLLAPAVTSHTGVTLAGRQLDTAGRWQGPAESETLAPSVPGYQLFLPRYSAALLAVHLKS